eukprot:934843-Amphidinium_carterae.1
MWCGICVRGMSLRTPTAAAATTKATTLPALLSASHACDSRRSAPPAYPEWSSEESNISIAWETKQERR